MRCLTVFAISMWLLVVSQSSDYWYGVSPYVTLIALVDVKVWLGIPSCGTRWVPRGSRGLILGSTGRGRPFLYPASVFPTSPSLPSPCFPLILPAVSACRISSFSCRPMTLLYSITWYDTAITHIMGWVLVRVGVVWGGVRWGFLFALQLHWGISS